MDTSYRIQKQAPAVNLDTRTRIQTQGLMRKARKVRKETVNTKAILAAVMLVMAGSTIMSTQVNGDTSSSQLTIYTQVGASTQLSHHTYSNLTGWSKQGPRDKPMVVVQANIDIPAYLTLWIKCLPRQ